MGHDVPMKNQILNRRSFLGLTAAGLAVLGRGGLVRAASAMAARDPDLIVVNGKVYTVDSRQPTAESFAVKDGRFVAVGSTTDIRALAGVNTEIFDAQHMTIVPGFNDSHNHAPAMNFCTKSWWVIRTMLNSSVLPRSSTNFASGRQPL